MGGWGGREDVCGGGGWEEVCGGGSGGWEEACPMSPWGLNGRQNWA